MSDWLLLTELCVAWLLSFTPAFLFSLLTFKREHWRSELPAWRRSVWLTGLALGIVCSLVLPLFLSGMQFLSKSATEGWFYDDGRVVLYYAWLSAPIVAVLFCFALGRHRGLGLLSSSLMFAELFWSVLWS